MFCEEYPLDTHHLYVLEGGNELYQSRVDARLVPVARSTSFSKNLFRRHSHFQTTLSRSHGSLRPSRRRRLRFLAGWGYNQLVEGDLETVSTDQGFKRAV